MIAINNPDNRLIWDDCLKYIALRIKKHSYNTWFRHTKAGNGNSGTLTILVPNQFVADWLKNRYSDFDTRKYGFNSLSSLTKSLSGIKTIKEKGVYYLAIDPLTSFEEISSFIEEVIAKNKSRKGGI